MEIIGEIIKQGFTGVLLAGALLVIAFQYRENANKQVQIDAEKDKRLADAVQAKQDAIAARDTIAEPLAVIKEYTILIHDKLKAEKERT